MKNGLVIIHYNDPESVINLINNVKNYGVLDRIVIVDNKSRLDALEKVKQLESSKVKIIENNENKGFSYAINIGSKYLINEFGECNLIISNADIEISSEDDLKKLISYLEKNDIGVVAPTVIENGVLNRGWKMPSPVTDALMNIVYIHNKIRKKKVFYNDDYYKDEFSYVDVVSGCFFLIKSNTLKEIEYFDEDVFLYYEENILAKKVSNINKKIIVCNNIKIKHNHSVSIDKNLKKLKKLKIQKKSQYYFQTKYNNANILEKVLLKVTVFVNRYILALIYWIKDLRKK